MLILSSFLLIEPLTLQSSYCYFPEYQNIVETKASQHQQRRRSRNKLSRETRELQEYTQYIQKHDKAQSGKQQKEQTPEKQKISPEETKQTITKEDEKFIEELFSSMKLPLSSQERLVNILFLFLFLLSFIIISLFDKIFFLDKHCYHFIFFLFYYLLKLFIIYLFIYLE